MISLLILLAVQLIELEREAARTFRRDKKEAFQNTRMLPPSRLSAEKF